MKHVVEAGTDAALLLIFDPGALPGDFDSRAKWDPIEILKTLTEQGRAYLINTSADGGYLLHVYVDEPLPEAMQQHAKDPETVGTFSAPTGKLYFTGAEYAFREDDAPLRKYPGMGGSFLVPPGDYRLTVFNMDYPEDLAEDRLREQVSSLAFGLHQNGGCFVGIAFLAFLGVLAALRWTTWESWLLFVFPPLGFLILLPFIVSRLRLVREADQKYKAIESEYPSYIAVMESRRDVGEPPLRINEQFKPANLESAIKP
jgi:hypothetical protein